MTHPSTVILHFDFDCFYTQVERRRLSIPASIPVAVVQWGSLLSVDYLARARGISRRSSEAEAETAGVRLVHSQVIDITTGAKFSEGPPVGANRSRMKSCLARYREASEEVMTIVKNALPQGAVFERASIDEAYVDVTSVDWPSAGFPEDPSTALHWFHDFSSFPDDTKLAFAGFLGERLRAEMLEKTGFTMTVGVASTREVSKLLCGRTKPDKCTIISNMKLINFMFDVPIKDVPYLGPRLLSWLQQRIPGVAKTTLCGALHNELDSETFSTSDEGRWLRDALLGLVNDTVKETGVRPTSIQASRIFRPPLQEAELEGILQGLMSEVVERLDDRIPKTLHIMFYAKHNEASHSRQMPWPRVNGVAGPMVSVNELTQHCLSLLIKSGYKPPYAFIQIGAKDLEEAIGWNKEAVNDYFLQSRLHFMGTWKQRYLQYMQEVEDLGQWGEDVTPTTTTTTLSAQGVLGVGEGGVFMLVDMDCFFCSVALAMDPTVNPGTPVAVCSGMGPTSEVSSANYPARARGVKAGTFVRTAQAACPELKILRISPALLARCEVTWKRVLRVLASVLSTEDGEFVISRIFGRSCDEALLDLTGLVSLDHPGLPVLASQIQQAVVQATQCPCSIGIACSRTLAKAATSEAKPKGVKIFRSLQEGRNLLLTKQVTYLSGVGYSTAEKLRAIGVESVEDLLRQSGRLPSLVGVGVAKKLLMTAQGEDNEEDVRSEIRQMSAEKNFGLRALTYESTEQLVFALTAQLKDRKPAKCEKLTVKILIAGPEWVEPAKKLGCGVCQAWSRSVACPSVDHIPRLAMQLMTADGIQWDRIRGLGVSLRLAVEKTPAGKPAGNTLDKWFNNKQAPPLLPVVREEVIPPPRSRALPEAVIELPATQAGVDVIMVPESQERSKQLSDECGVCGHSVAVGQLISHFLRHLKEEPNRLVICGGCGSEYPLISLAQHQQICSNISSEHMIID